MTDPDVRFTLANERTFLAYERTAIALVAAGIAVFHLLGPGWSDRLLGGLLLIGGLVVSVVGWLRFRSAERAIIAGRHLPTGTGVNAIAVVVLVCIAAAALSVLV